MAFRARKFGRCEGQECPQGGRIEPGEMIKYLNLNEGRLRYFHVGCVPRASIGTPTTTEAPDVKGMVSAAAETLKSFVRDEVAAVEVRLMDQIQMKAPERTLKIEQWDGTTVTLEKAHNLLPRCLYYVSRRKHVYLWGPPGSGKSTAAQQAAEALGLDYAYVSLNPQSPASLLTGFIDANGRYVETPFYRCYKNGGVFCIDELDNASPQLLTTLNGALANGKAAFPRGMVDRHPDFVLVATGNTPGRGGDWHHPERRAIDSATLDRLAFVYWPYDEALENQLVLGANPEAGQWLSWVRAVRSWVADQSNGVRGVYATPRAAIEGAIDLAATSRRELPLEQIAETHVFKGIAADVTQRVLRACPLPA